MHTVNNKKLKNEFFIFYIHTSIHFNDINYNEIAINKKIINDLIKFNK